MGILYRQSRTYAGFLKETRIPTWVGFLKETHVNIKKIIFVVFLGIFKLWCLLESFS